MIIPREIREKIEQRNQLDEEIAGWFQENVDAYGCDIKNAYVVDEPKGEEQIEEGEYCKQSILGEDCTQDSIIGRWTMASIYAWILKYSLNNIYVRKIRKN